MLQGFVNFQFLGRLDQLRLRASSRIPRSRPTASRCSRRTTATSWGTARAASWAARCRRSRPSGTASSSACPVWTTAGCCSTARSTGTSSPRSTTRRTPTPSTSRSCCSSRSCSGTAVRTRGTRNTSRRTRTRYSGEAGLHHRELRRPPGRERVGRDAGADDRRAESPAGIRSVVLRCGPAAEHARHAAVGAQEAGPGPSGRPAGLVLWDYGTPTPPTDNLAPNGAAYGADPHGFGRGNTLLRNRSRRSSRPV